MNADLTCPGDFVGLLTTSGASDSVTYLTVGSNQFVGNKLAGLELFNSINGVFQYNDVSGNGDPQDLIKTGFGLAIAANGGSSVANTVNNNVANGNAYGITIATNVTGTRIVGNVTNGNVQAGIVIQRTSNQIFSNSSSVGNGGFDLADASPTCDSNLWSNNVFFTRNYTCIH